MYCHSCYFTLHQVFVHGSFFIALGWCKIFSFSCQKTEEGHNSIVRWISVEYHMMMYCVNFLDSARSTVAANKKLTFCFCTTIVPT